MSDQDKEALERDELTPEREETPPEEQTLVLSEDEQPDTSFHRVPQSRDEEHSEDSDSDSDTSPVPNILGDGDTPRAPWNDEVDVDDSETESGFRMGPTVDDTDFETQETTSISTGETGDSGEADTESVGSVSDGESDTEPVGSLSETDTESVGSFSETDTESVGSVEPVDPVEPVAAQVEPRQLMGDDSALEVNTVPASAGLGEDEELTEVYVLEEEDATSFAHADDLPADFDEPTDFMGDVGDELAHEYQDDDAATEFTDAAAVEDATEFQTSDDLAAGDNLDALAEEVEDELFAHRGTADDEEATDLFDEVDESAGSPWGKVVACAAALLVVGGIGFYFFQKTSESHAQPGTSKPPVVVDGGNTNTGTPPPPPAAEPWRTEFRNQFLVAVKLGFSGEVNHEGR